jgi:hypothetical protein
MESKHLIINHNKKHTSWVELVKNIHQTVSSLQNESQINPEAVIKNEKIHGGFIN